MKKYLPFKNQQIWKDSAVLAFALLGGIDLFTSIADVSLGFTSEWWIRVLVIIGAYIVLLMLMVIVKAYRASKEIHIEIRGVKITLKECDIFEANGWKVIPFNEQL